MGVASTPDSIAQLRLKSERRLAWVATSLMFLPGVLWAYVDASVAEGATTMNVLYGVRAAQFVLWAAGIWIIRRAQSRTELRRVLFLLALGIVAFITTNGWLRPADNWMPLRTVVLISIGTFVVYPYGFRYQLVAWGALLVSAASLMWGHYVSMPGYDRMAAVLNVLIAGALGMTVARNRSGLERDLDEALARERAAIEVSEHVTEELATLQGIIPICMYCHEVRTEAGAWEQLDHYVRQRTAADFSHGICPNCMKKQFPQYAEPSPAP